MILGRGDFFAPHDHLFSMGRLLLAVPSFSYLLIFLDRRIVVVYTRYCSKMMMASQYLAASFHWAVLATPPFFRYIQFVKIHRIAFIIPSIWGDPPSNISTRDQKNSIYDFLVLSGFPFVLSLADDILMISLIFIPAGEISWMQDLLTPQGVWFFMKARSHLKSSKSQQISC